MAADFQARDTVVLARSLLGKMLVRSDGSGRTEALVTEVEAYHGADDLACHASKGRTKRTEILFGPAGRWYVYLCYGIHEMLNLVTGPVDHPAAILIRGVAGISGPGRLTKAWRIDRKLNGRAAHPASGLHLEDAGVVVPKNEVTIGPRIGIDYAGPIWSTKPWRFRWDAPAM
ncbi:MAG TPA: DNA-3-methyladenine glycosylase [Candidatus Didemnitutus sp.]|nr:DNA-3-methyladenine glycosylase [Candidatus Didemnitutus sp.]